MSDPAAPHELPPAYVPPAYIAPASALDQPALGLVLALAALFALPQSAMLLAQCLLLDLGDVKMLALAGLMVAGALLQLASGVAIAWQWRVRAPLFFACVACGAALMLCVFALWRDELPLRAATVMTLETLGGPLLVVLAPRLFGVRRIARGHALGGLLIVGALSTFVSLPASLVERVGEFARLDVTVGTWLGEGLRVAFVLATAVLQLAAGLRMARGQPARKFLAAYVIVALVGTAGLQLIGIIYWLADRDEMHIRYVLASLVIDLVLGVIRPLLIWYFAKREGDPGPRVDAALPWLALWFAPQLAARCLLGQEIDEFLGDFAWPLVALGAMQAIACVVAARAALRDDNAVVAWRIAAIMAAALLAFVVYWVFAPHDVDEGSLTGGFTARRMFGVSQVIWPVALLFTTLATGAWLANRGRSSS